VAERRRRAPRRKPAERRDDVLDAALRLIIRDGYASATMTAIARELDLTKPVVYSVFPNFEALATTLLEREQQRCLAQIQEALTETMHPGVTATEMIPAALDAFLRSVVRSPERWRLVLMGDDATPPMVAARVQQGRELAFAALVGICQQLFPPGSTGSPDGPDVELMAHAMNASVERIAQLVLAEPERWTQERLDRFVRHDIPWPKIPAQVTGDTPG